jgi:hypothetical protein
LALFTGAVFVSAALLFVVQPMVGRMVLPRGGGSPQVWNTSLVFFQVALLAGYVYAHYSVRWLGVRGQAAVHAGVLLLPLLVLPIALPDTPPPGGGSQAFWILGLLALGVGAPFFVLATMSPLLQRWLAATEHEDAKDPYFLYAGSNAGSLLGLLAYPFLLEPLLPLSGQTRLWAFGYAGFALLAIGCASFAMRAGSRPEDHGHVPAAAEPEPLEADRADAGAASPRGLPNAQDRLFWLAASAVPSALLMGVTQFLTSGIAPVPLLWVLPLAAYLLTFIVAFGRRRIVGVPTVSRLFSVATVVLALVLLARISDPTWLVTTLHLGVLVAAGLLCHMRLVDARPAATHLTEFYLFIAAGGALGGTFSALVAPYVFDSVAEYPIAVVLACLFRLPMSAGGGRDPAGATRYLYRGRSLDFAAPALLAAYMVLGELGLDAISSIPDGVYVILLVVLPTLACFLFSPRPLRFAIGAAVLLTFAQAGLAYRGDVLLTERTFFGVYRVSSDPANTVNIFYHGPTAHGVQSRDPALAGEPLAYYHRTGPAGGIVSAVAMREDKRHIALVGAGTGALTALAGPHQHVTLYEIDPVVMEIAEDPRFFTFLRDARASHEAVVGDGRIELQRTTERYDLMVLDAFTSGSIPIHLLTREAVELYLERLRPGGFLLFHISNRHLNLAPVLARHAADLGLVAYQNADARGAGSTGPGLEQHVFASHWVVLARSAGDLAYIPDAGWSALSASLDAPLWTDDFSNLLSVLRWD